MKKILKALLAIIIIVIIIVAVLAILLVNNSNVMTSEVEEDTRTVETIVKSSLVDTVANADSTKTIEAGFSVDQLNYIIGAVFRGLEEKEVSKYLRGAAIQAEDEDTLTLKVGAKYSIFKTVAQLTMDYKADGDDLVFTVNTIKLGRIKAPTKLLNTIFKKLKLDDALQNITVAGQKIDITIAYSPLSIKIAKQNLVNLIVKAAMSDGDNVTGALLGWAANESFSTFNFGENGIGITINTTSLEYDATRDGDLCANLDTNVIDTKIKTLLDNKTITEEQAEVSANFIVRGYDALNTNQKTVVNGIDFSSIGITNNQTYAGMVPHKEFTFYQRTIESAGSALNAIDLNSPGSGTVTLKMSDADMTDLIVSKGVIGTTSVLYGIGSDGKYVVATIIIESIRMEITDNAMSMCIVVSIDGERLSIKLNTTANPQAGHGITTNYSALKVGDNTANETLANAFYTTLKTVASDSDWITVDDAAKTIELSYKNVIENNNKLSLLTKFSAEFVSEETSLVGQNEGDGLLQYRLSWNMAGI